MTAAAHPDRPASAWAPLRYFPVFRALWIAQFASNVGTWMQTVGAQWLLIDTSPLLVSLVQTAASLPIVLLALPAGAWADVVDRRKLLLGAQLAMFLAAAALAVSTFLADASPTLILALTFALGCGNAVASPAWQAIQPDLVDRGLLPQAAALNGLNMNIARAVGPAIGGFLVAGVGAGWVFALNALSFVGIATVVACWRGARARPRELTRAAGRSAARGRQVRAARTDRAPVAVPLGPVHPGRQRDLGPAAGRRGHQPGPRLGRLRVAARHGRARRGRGRGGDPARALEVRLCPARHRRDARDGRVPRGRGHGP